jgi:hypothetical protein
MLAEVVFLVFLHTLSHDMGRYEQKAQNDVGNKKSERCRRNQIEG